MSLGRLDVNEDDRFERPVPPERTAREGLGGGLLKGTIAVVAVALFAASIWYAYQRGASEATVAYQPPLIRADPSPSKLKPDDPGGLAVPNRDKLVYQRLVTDQPDKRVERLLPPPEAPLDKPKPEAGEAGAADAGPIVVGTTQVVAPKAVAPRTPPPKRETELKLALDPKTGEAKLPADTAPAAGPAAPAVEAPAAAPAAPPTRTAAVAAKAAGYGVQLAALKDEAGTANEWRRLQAAFGSILGKLSLRVERADLGDRGVFFRLIATSFTNEDRASKACAELKALEQDCLVVPLD